MKSILVIGLGRFGRNLAIDLAALGVEVTAIDKDEEKVNRIKSYVSKAFIGDCTDMSVLRSLKVKSFSACFVCITGSFQSSLVISSQLKELGAAHVISKADRDVDTRFLSKIGSDEIIYIEKDAAHRTAVKYSVNNAFEYIELTDEYAISEMLVPKDWVGLSIKALDFRSRLNVNVVAIKKKEKVMPVTDPNYTLSQNEHLIVAGLKKDIYSMLDK